MVMTEWRGDCLGLAWSGEWGGRLASDSVALNREEVGPTGGGRERQRSGVEIGPCWGFWAWAFSEAGHIGCPPR